MVLWDVSFHLCDAVIYLQLVFPNYLYNFWNVFILFQFHPWELGMNLIVYSVKHQIPNNPTFSSIPPQFSFTKKLKTMSFHLKIHHFPLRQDNIMRYMEIIVNLKFEIKFLILILRE
jgi:hypothetical protein